MPRRKETGMGNSKILFEGEAMLSGLSNERELAKACPEKFKKHWMNDPWCKMAMNIFYCGGVINHWKWRTKEMAVFKKQFGCFRALLSGFGLSHEDKIAVAGWMLSEMLTEVPAHIKVEDFKA